MADLLDKAKDQSQCEKIMSDYEKTFKTFQVAFTGFAERVVAKTLTAQEFTMLDVMNEQWKGIQKKINAALSRVKKI